MHDMKWWDLKDINLSARNVSNYIDSDLVSGCRCHITSACMTNAKTINIPLFSEHDERMRRYIY